MSPLDRFRRAQESPSAGYSTALAEIRSGRKRGHWIWYVLPQIRGLGSSGMSRRYAIADGEEAAAYLREPELSARLLEITRAILARLRAGVPLRTLMGSEIDALKAVSSLTLFGQVAARLGGDHAPLAQAAAEVLAIAKAQGYSPCAHTLRTLTE